MTQNEAFEEIIKRKKWYAGLRSRNQNFYEAHSANKVIKRYKAGKLSNEIIVYIISMSGFKLVKEAEYEPTSK